MTLTEPATTPERRQRHLALVAFTILALLVLYGSARVIAPFATPVIMAALVVVLTFQLYRKLSVKLRGRNYLSATVMLLGITVVIILPTFLLIVLLVQQANLLVQEMQDAKLMERINALNPTSYLGWVKRIAPSFDPATVDLRSIIMNVVRGIPKFVTVRGGQLLAGVVGLVIGFILMLLASFYFYVDGERLVRGIISLSPFPDRFDQEIIKKFDDVINATFRGQILTALAQGIVTGIGLTIANVPGSIFWGAVAAVFSLLPMVGAGAIWVPATIWLFLSGHQGMGIFLAIWGILAISTVDNLVRPWAMKDRTDLPAIVLLFSVLGGISAFGFVGLVLGPLVFALLLTVVNIYRHLFRDALEEKGAGSDLPVETNAANLSS